MTLALKRDLWQQQQMKMGPYMLCKTKLLCRCWAVNGFAVILFPLFGCVFEAILILSTLLGFSVGLAFPFGFKEAILILSTLLGFGFGSAFPFGFKEAILILSTLLGFGFGTTFPFGFKEASLILSTLLGLMHGHLFPDPVFFKGCFESL